MNTSSSPRPLKGFPVLNVLMLVTAVALMACLGYGLKRWLQGEDDVAWFAPDAGCQLGSGACTATLDEARLSLAVDVEGPIHALTPLPLEIKVEGLEASQASVAFLGRDMEMGHHRFTLMETAPGHFNGQGQVGLCTQAVMAWRAQVILNTPEGKIGSWFDFEVTRS